jgi:hypothetical protein
VVIVEDRTMKTFDIIRTETLAAVLALGIFCEAIAQTSPNTVERVPILQKYLKMATQAEQQKSETASTTEPARPRTSAIRMADFYMRDGKLMFGKLVTEDKNKVTIEQLEGSNIVVSTYSKRDIDPRTLQTRAIPEYKYYIDLAEYFTGRTWDFRDDPDDFIQAIRCYEKAKQLIVSEAQDNERIGQINAKIKQLQADREVWTREVESRAKLRKLELEAEFDNRIKELENKVNASSQKVSESVERLDKALTLLQENQKKFEQGLSVIEQETSRRLNIIGGQVEANRRLVDPFYFAPRYRYPSEYYYRPGY